MNMNVRRMIGIGALVSLPLSAAAGTGQSETQKQDLSPNSAIEQNARNWAVLDLGKYGLTPPSGQAAYLQDSNTQVGTSRHSELLGLAGLEQGDRFRAAVERGQHLIYGPENSSKAMKIFAHEINVQGPTEASKHQSFNKREMLIEIQEAMIEQNGKARN
jgi:hypothetical protein